MIKNKLFWAYFLLAILFFTQGFIKKVIFPFNLIESVYDLGSITAESFFIMPFLWIFAELVYLLIKAIIIKIRKVYADSLARHFLFFFVNMMSWFVSMFLSASLHVLFFRTGEVDMSILNFFLAFFCMLKFLRGFYGIDLRINLLFNFKQKNERRNHIEYRK